MSDVTFTEEQQALVDKLVGEARVKAREKAEADAREKATADQEAARLAKLETDQKWQELVQEHKAKAAQLEPLTKQVEEYEKLVAGMLKDELVSLGEAASKAVDGLPETMTVIEKLAWLHKNEGLFQQPSGGPIGTPNRGGQKKPDQQKPSEPISRFSIRL